MRKRELEEARKPWHLKLLGRYTVEDKDGPDADKAMLEAERRADEAIREADRRMLEAERRAEEAELRAMEIIEEVEGSRRWSRLRRRMMERRKRVR